jgi:spermidine synthase
MKRRAAAVPPPVVPGAWFAGLASAIAMAMEVLSPRVLAPFVGTTVPVWTAVIAVTLAGMALGAAIGGRVADAFPRRAIDAWALALTAPALLALPALGAAAADGAGSLEVRALLGASASILLPSLLLGAVAPAVAREAVRVSTAPARSLGRIAAAGAVGGLAGVVLAAMVLVPHVHTSHAFAGLAAVCAVGAAVRAWRTRGRRGDAVPQAAPPPPTEPAMRFAPAAALSAAVGAAILVVEVLAARSTATRAGSSLPTWAAVIGVALVGLTVGSSVGGRLAARHPAKRLLPLLLLAAAAATALAAALDQPVAAILAGSRLPFTMRSAVGVCLRFLPAFVVLGAVPPVLAHAVLTSHARDGRRVGGISAWGTAGALVGAVATAPLLLPAVGLEHAFAATAAALLLGALACGALSVSARGTLLAAGVTAVLAAVASPLVIPRGNALWVHDGAYARILVDPTPADRAHGRAGTLRLVLDDRAQGYQDPDDPTWLGAPYLGVFLAIAERLVPEEATPRILCLGGGCYTLPRALLASIPRAHVDVVEIDPVVTRAARERLGLAAEPGFAVFHEDARTFVRRTKGEPPYDLVFADTFGSASVPWHLTTKEFFEAVRERVPNGVVVFNVIDVFAEARFYSAVNATIGTVFSRVTTVGAERHETWPKNLILVASDRAVDLADLARVDPADPVGTRLPVVRYDEDEIAELARKLGTRPLTDEWAPVDSLMKQVYERR